MKKIGMISLVTALASLYLSPDGADGGSPAVDGENKEDKPEAHKVKLVTVTNNDIAIDIFELKQTRGRDIGAIYLAPDLDTLTIDQVSKFWPAETLLENFVRPALKRLCNGFTRAAKEVAKGDAQVMVSKFVDYFKELTAKSDSIRALKVKQTELLNELRKLDPTKPEELQVFISVGVKIKQISNQIAELLEAAEEEKESTEITPSESLPAQAA